MNMIRKQYNKAEITSVSVCIKERILAGSSIENINVSDVGQDLATPVDFEEKPFTIEIEWE